MSHPRDTGVAGRPYIYKDLDQDQKQEEQERESTRDKFDAPPTPRLAPSLSGPDPALIEKLADLTQLDAQLNHQALVTTARQLTKGGYTTDDLHHFEHYWYTHDWRGKKHSPPYLHQIIQTIRKALEHTAAPASRRSLFAQLAQEYNHR